MTVDDLSIKIKTLSKKFLNVDETKETEAKGLLNKLRLAKFIQALRPDLALEVRKAGIEKFEEAKIFAERLENVLNTDTNTEMQEKLQKVFLNSQIEDLKAQINNMSVKKVQFDKKKQKKSSVFIAGSLTITPRIVKLKRRIRLKIDLQAQYKKNLTIISKITIQQRADSILTTRNTATYADGTSTRQMSVILTLGVRISTDMLIGEIGMILIDDRIMIEIRV